MNEGAIKFDDGDAYERAIGRWSRAVAPRFLQWLAVPPRMRWLDVGCGTGVLASAIVELAAPTSVAGVDPEPAQLLQAARGSAGAFATFQVGDARALPFAEAAFDVTASALVLNFVAERGEALAEMRRVTRPGGWIAAYVWDFAEELSPSGPLRRGMERCGLHVPTIPGTAESRLPALVSLFSDAGMQDIETTTFDVCLAYRDFEDFWGAQTPDYVPTSKIIAAMTAGERVRLMREVRAGLPPVSGGVVEYVARANAIKARRGAAR